MRRQSPQAKRNAKALKRIAESHAVPLDSECGAHPSGDDLPHECMASERRCVYCGAALHPWPCNGCGRFLRVEEMADVADSGVYRCEDCR